MLDVVEETQWDLDYNTQALETGTGITATHMHDVQPLDPEELKFNKSLHIVAEFAMFISSGSVMIRSNFAAMAGHLIKYEEVCRSMTGFAVRSRGLENLQSGCALKVSLAELQHGHIEELRARLQAQLDITKALVVQRDTLVQIDIAQASKRDAEYMQGIAVVTMIFLPGTFVATFFSMVSRFGVIVSEDGRWIVLMGRTGILPCRQRGLCSLDGR